MSGAGTVAVCFPCWNQWFYTQNLIASIRRNSAGHDVRLIALDNGSTDRTGDYLPSAVDELITLPDNVGVNPAWNQLLAQAIVRPEVDVVCLINNDVVVGPGWLDAPTRALRDPDNRSYFLPNGGFTTLKGFDDVARLAVTELAGQRVAGRAGWCMFFTPEMVRLFHPIPPELILWFGDDWAHYKLAEAGYRCEVLLDSCALHFISKTVGLYPDMVETIERDRQHFRRLTGMDV